ncbi:hypothetical protein N752_09150 [Desulforamulus aquiferis]|nr:hypothetical protein N752_09150 [Desulforamulus aquiferis]
MVENTREVEQDTMFMGEFQHNTDPKGRLIIPARFREGLGDRFIVTKGLDNCLFVYPLHEWAEVEQKLKSLPFARQMPGPLYVFSFRELPNAR